MKKIFAAILTILSFTSYLYADIAWKNMGRDINCKEFNCVTVELSDPAIIYVGTSNGAYVTEDGGQSWQRIFTGWGKRKNVRDIYARGNEIYICTDGGLFVSKDRGRHWSVSFGIASKSQVFSIAVLTKDTPILFIATDKGVFKSIKGKKEWKRVYSNQGDDDIDIDDENEDGETDLPKVRSIAISFNYPERLYFGTEDGLFISEDEGESLKHFSDEGLLDKGIDFIIESPLKEHNLYTISEKDIFYYDDGWHIFKLSSNLRDARSIAFDLDPKNSMWVATKRGVYKSVEGCTDEERIELETLDTLNLFRDEPTISEVQKEAVRYAEVYPEKIANWRKRANISAILPRLSFGIDEDNSDTYEIYTSASQQYIVKGPRKSADGWDITLTWDLGDLIWNSDQTLIDVRSKLMVQLRDDILDEVNSYYFERRRLQIELLEAPPENKKDRIKKELRIQELTANIDGLTGGYFINNLNKRF